LNNVDKYNNFKSFSDLEKENELLMSKLKQKESSKQNPQHAMFHNETEFNQLRKSLEDKPILKYNTKLGESKNHNNQLTATKTIIFEELEHYKIKTQTKIDEMKLYY
jgi:hypothetical protein